MKYDERIHSQQFRVVARHLANPETPIQAVLHVKSVSMLSALAERVEMLTASPGNTGDLIRALEPLMREKSLLLSLPEKTANPFSEFVIPTSSLRPSAWSKVLYMPPFYLVHTPGLFEQVARPEQVESAVKTQKLRPLRFKM